MASRLPVEAPDGTMARPKAPDSSHTSTSTVGLPRESRISRAWRERISDRALRLSLEDEMRKRAEGLGGGAEGREGGEGLAHQLLRAGPRGVETVQGWIGRLLLRLVLARGLAELLGGARHVEDVVHDLEGQAEVAAGDGEGTELVRGRAGQARAHPAGSAEERRGLV